MLGGFTTLSAFGIDTIRLFRDHAYVAGSANVLLQLAIGLTAVVVGLRIGQALKAVWLAGNGAHEGIPYGGKEQAPPQIPRGVSE